MNKSELVSRLTHRLDGDRAKATVAVNGVLEEIQQSLARGEKVSLFGFGTFDRRERGPRTARNPATGETIQVGASVAPVFRAGAGLKQLLEDAGTARADAANTASAAAAVPAAAASATAPAKKAAKKAASEGSKSSPKAADKAKAKKADAGTGKASKKGSGKGTKKR